MPYYQHEINQTQQKFLDKCVKNFEESKDFFYKIMNEKEDDAAILMKWIIDNNINPYSVFSPNCGANCFSSIEHFTGLYSLFHSAIDRADISYVKFSYFTKTKLEEDEYVIEHEMHPMILFIWRYENNFEDYVKESFGITNKNFELFNEVTKIKIDLLNNVNEYISEYNRVEMEHKKLHEEVSLYLEGI